MNREFICPCCGTKLTAEEVLSFCRKGFSAFGSRAEYFKNLNNAYPVKIAQALEELYVSALEATRG